MNDQQLLDKSKLSGARVIDYRDFLDFSSNYQIVFTLPQLTKLVELVVVRTLHDDTELISAAKAVIERWDSPLWKDLPHTGEAINRLRKAIERVE